MSSTSPFPHAASALSQTSSWNLFGEQGNRQDNDLPNWTHIGFSLLDWWPLVPLTMETWLWCEVQTNHSNMHKYHPLTEINTSWELWESPDHSDRNSDGRYGKQFGEIWSFDASITSIAFNDIIPTRNLFYSQRQAGWIGFSSKFVWLIWLVAEWKMESGWAQLV